MPCDCVCISHYFHHLLTLAEVSHALGWHYCPTTVMTIRLLVTPLGIVPTHIYTFYYNLLKYPNAKLTLSVDDLAYRKIVFLIP